MRCERQRPCGRRGHGRAAGEERRSRLGRIRYSSGLLEPLLCELGIDLGLESIPSPERRGQRVNPRGVIRADLRERARASAPAQNECVHVCAHGALPWFGR